MPCPRYSRSVPGLRLDHADQDPPGLVRIFYYITEREQCQSLERLPEERDAPQKGAIFKGNRMRLCEMGVRGEKGAPHEIRPTEPRGASQLPGPLFQCPLCPIWLQGYGKNHRMRRNWVSTCGRFSVADLGEVPQKYPQGRGAGAKREGTGFPIPSQKVQNMDF